MKTLRRRHAVFRKISIGFGAGLALMSCTGGEFRGVSPRAPKAPSCQPGEAFVGANFMFMIDNSGSMKLTDCPKSTDNENRCTKTEREQAIMKSFDTLLQAASTNASQDPGQGSPLSTVSIAKFTPEDRYFGLDEFEEPVFFTVETLPENRQLLQDRLQFTRQPKGDTPYLNALQLGQRFLDSGALHPDQDHYLILITDGEPTDRSPSAVRQAAAALDAKILTMRIRNPLESEAEDRRAFHRRIIEEEYSDWATDPYNNLDQYVDDLLKLAPDISNEPVIALSNAAELETEIFEKILKKNLPCIDSQ